MTTIAIVENRLKAAFAPEVLEIRNDSEQHRGHGGYIEGEVTHIHIVMTATAFDGLSRVARQRAVMKALATEMEATLHAVSMDISGVNN